jgi:hypothetical protein
MLHPKPEGLLHPKELWKHTAFENLEERTIFLDQPLKLGKPTASNPQGGIKQKYHDFANKLWLKSNWFEEKLRIQLKCCGQSKFPGMQCPLEKA